MSPWPQKDELTTLREAARDLRYLLARGYRRRHAVTFVGDRFQFDNTLRHILFRAVFPRAVAKERRKKRLKAREIRGQRLVVDGYNCFITLESGLKGETVIYCDDGFFRDVSGVFRRFRPSELTETAWSLMARVFKRYRPEFIQFLLDKPYSNSGRFCGQIRSWMVDAGLDGTCALFDRSERHLCNHQGDIVASGDSVIIDSCNRLFDLTGHILRHYLRARSIKL